MRKSTHIFLTHFVSAFNSSKPYFITSISKSAFQLCITLKQAGLIYDFEFIEKEELPLVWKVKPKNRKRLIRIWLFSSISGFIDRTNEQRGGVNGTEQLPISRRSFSFIKICRKPSRPVYLNHKNLQKVASLSTLRILQTTKGFLTCKEALFFKLGGIVLLTIHFLKLKYLFF